MFFRGDLNRICFRIKAENYKEHEEVVQAVIDDMAKANFQFPSIYKQGPLYAYEVGFPPSLAMELPDKRGTLNFEFHPSTNLIRERVKETWIGIRAIACKFIEKYPINWNLKRTYDKYL